MDPKGPFRKLLRLLSAGLFAALREAEGPPYGPQPWRRTKELFREILLLVVLFSIWGLLAGLVVLAVWPVVWLVVIAAALGLLTLAVLTVFGLPVVVAQTIRQAIQTRKSNPRLAAGLILGIVVPAFWIVVALFVFDVL